MFTKMLSDYSKQMLVCFSLGVLPVWAALAAPTIAITGPSGAIEAGSTFSLNVAAGDVTDLYAYQFTINYDPTQFRAISVSEGAFLPSGGTTFFDAGTIDNTTGAVEFVLGTLLGDGPGVSGSGILDVLQFQSIGEPATIGMFRLSDVFALTSALEVIPVTTSDFAITVVSEPATMALLAIAAFGLAGAAVRRGPVTREAWQPG